MAKRKINIVTLGCSKNLVDSEKLLRQIEHGGYAIEHNSSADDADTVIINTCGFINDAKEESVDTILRFVKARQKGELRHLFVMGCLSERYADALRGEIPEVDKYFGVNDLGSIVKELGLELKKEVMTDRTLTGPGHYAYLKVSEGCDRSCSFCAIPAIRGKCISRPLDEIIEEARLLASRGVKEIILIAQDLSYYGLDLYKKQMLPDLLSGLLEIRDFEWIRLHYLYPANFPWQVIEIMKNNPRVCRYIDIPVQHISDRILSDMKRSHSKEDTIKLLERISMELPDAVIRTTLIAGFPGETDEEFTELVNFITDFRFNRLGVFPYSHEEGTGAFDKFEDNVPHDVKEERVATLMEIQQEISASLNQELVGKSLKVLIDRREGDYFVGRTEYDSPEVDQEILIPVLTRELKLGCFYKAMVTSSAEFDLYGLIE
ncbi:MAG: 30S ribosomal protein S12 methylthiotransferase RimO [Bacteroidales bacterium]